MNKKVIRHLIVITILILLFTFHLLIEWNSPIYPPTRRGIGNGRSTPAKLHNFKTAIEDSDIVAHIMIGDWLGEDDHSTYYEAKIIEQFKGDPVSTIILHQNGCSRYTYGCYPLFISGNELLVFLKQSTFSIMDDSYYYSIDSARSVLYAVIDKNGDAYYLDRNGSLSFNAVGIIDPLPQDAFTRELYQKVILEDPELAKDMLFENVYFYSRKDFLKLLP